jgi:hypothetical protein
MKRSFDDSVARSLGGVSSAGVTVADTAAVTAAVTAPDRATTAGAWATDHAPSRSKKSSGASWYFEYTFVCTRNRSSGYRRCSRSSGGISSIGVNRS